MAFFISASNFAGMDPCLSDSLFLIIPGIDPLISTSAKYETFVLFSSILSSIHPPMKSSPRTTPLTSGHG